MSKLSDSQHIAAEKTVEHPCKFCLLEIDEPENWDSNTCEGCWYGMRLEPEEWSERMDAIGRKPIYRGGCVPLDINGKGIGIVCRDGFVPPLEVIDGEGGEEWRTVNNDRGLGTYLEAKDTKGEYYRVQDSSAATEPCVWIFTKQKTGEHLGHDQHAALHLNKGQAEDLISALQEFVDH